MEEDGDLKKRLIGTGPFILKEHERKVKMVLTRNPEYFDKGSPYIDEYRILSTPDAATRLAAFRTGQSDILGLQSLADVETVRKTNPTAVVQETTTVLTVFGLALRLDKPPFNDVRVRRAMSMAIDRHWTCAGTLATGVRPWRVSGSRSKGGFKRSAGYADCGGTDHHTSTARPFK